MVVTASLYLCFVGWAQQPSEKPKPVEDDSVVAGTVFRTPGFMLPGAQVEISLYTPEGETPKFKFKKTKLISNTAGEFALRVAGRPAVYIVVATAPGYTSQTKKAQVEGPAERTDVNFELEPVKK
jgi:hypothetical protein